MTDTPGTGTTAGEAGTGTTSGHGHSPQALSALGWTSFLMPLVVSVLANLTWGVGTGSVVLIVAGLVSPLLLVLAVERWRALPGLTGAARVVQIVGMGIVATVAAGWSWVHTTDLLLDAVRQAGHLPPDAPLGDLPWLVVVLCVVAPLAVDGLAVLSVQTLAITSNLVLTPVPELAAIVPEQAAGAPADVPGHDGWGPADTVPSSRTARPARARPVPSVDGQRTKRELIARARELSVPRKAKEPLEQFRARVEHAERAQAPAVPTTDAVPA